MKATVRLIAAAAGLWASHCVMAQAPVGATGQCKDGTYSTAASKAGACRGHQGIKDWYAAAGAKASAEGKTSSGSTNNSSATNSSSKSTNKTAGASAATTGPAPVGATGQCNDGSYSMAASKAGACRGHQGVKEWYAAAAAPAGKSAPGAKAAAATNAGSGTNAASPVKSASSPQTVSSPQTAGAGAGTAGAPGRESTPWTATNASKPSAQQASGGGPGMVWVNTPTKVYHCAGTEFYGKTKEGKYMSESDARASGARPDHNKPCKQ